MIGVYLVILGFELDPPELLLVLLVLKLLEPPDLPLVSDNSTIAIRTMVTINTVVNRIFVEFCKKSVLLRSISSLLMRKFGAWAQENNCSVKCVGGDIFNRWGGGLKS